MASLSSSERDGRRRRSRSRPARRWSVPTLSGLSAIGVVRLLFVLSVLVAVVPLGAVSWANLNLAAIAMAATTVLAMLVAGENGPARWAGRTALAVVTLLGLYVVMQVQVTDANPYAHPAWTIAGTITGAKAAAISIDPGQSWFALVALVLPFLAFLAALALYRTDADALRLLRVLAVMIGAIAIFGIVQFLLFPDTLIVFDKTDYRDSLTGVFVNRNTAATLFGLGSLLIFIFVQQGARGRWLEIGGALVNRPAAFLAAERGLAGWLCLMVATLLALVLTRSRAGVAATLIAYMVLIPLLAVDGARRAGGSRGRGVRILAGVMAVLAIALVFAGQAIYRADVQGLEDARFCIMPGLFATLKDNWLFGSGFATFGDVFPAYRDPACGPYGLWDKAHDFYLEGGITLGVAFWVAVAVVYVALGLIWARGWRVRRRLRVVPAVGLAATVQVTLHDMIDFSLQIPGFAVVAATALAGCVVVALGRQRQDEAGERIA